jgi:hypothetical protein
MDKSTFKHTTAVYFGPEERANKQLSPIRTVVALAVVGGVGVLLCVWGHASLGTPLIGVGVLMPVRSWYRRWEMKRQ